MICPRDELFFAKEAKASGPEVRSATVSDADNGAAMFRATRKNIENAIYKRDIAPHALTQVWLAQATEVFIAIQAFFRAVHRRAATASRGNDRLGPRPSLADRICNVSLNRSASAYCELFNVGSRG